jgi:hypothetical protein
VHLAAPVILIPFSCNANDDVEVWFVNLGVLKVQTPEALIKDPNSGNYDEFEIQLEDLTFKYYHQLGHCKALINSNDFRKPNEVHGGELISYNVIKNFDIKVKAKVLRSDI